MKVTDILSAQAMQFDLQAATKEEVIQALTKCLVSCGNITDEAQFLEAVNQREEHATTGIGFGVAIPHGKSTAVTESTIGFAKLTQPVEWQSLDDKPVEIVFLLAIAEHDKSDGHLKILSEIATKLMDDQVVLDLKAAESPEQVIQSFSEGVYEQ